MASGLTLGEQSWAALTADEVRARGDEDGAVLVVPVGSIEQHGDHLPVATDTLLVDGVVEEAAERADAPLLVTPPVWHGVSPHHMPFGGTITLNFDDALDTLEGVADAALENGFDAIVLVNGHGGNKSLVGAASTTIGQAHPSVEVSALTYFDLAGAFEEEIRQSEMGGMAHGGEFETALMLHLHPDLVREDRMEAPPMDEPYERGTQDLLHGGPLTTYRPFDEYSETGAIGDPELASAEQGAEILDRLGAELADVFETVHANVSGD